MKKLLSFLIAVLCLSTQVYAEKITASTTLPDKGVPEHVYTMRNCSDTPYYATATTSPTQNDAAKGVFAFYAVDGVNGAYYIYSCNEKKWLEYSKAASYNGMKGFVTLSKNRTSDVYFKVDNYSGDNYQISPYKTDGAAAAIYLNWYQGANANEGQTVGLWTDGGSKDGGSRWVFAATELTVFKYTVSVPQGVTLKIDGKEYANGSEVSSFAPIALGDVTAIAGDGKFAIVSIDEVNKTITVNVATLPELPEVAKYENAWVYPKQQDNVGAASLTKVDDSYILKNNVLAAAWMKVGDALYFAGANAMNLVAGTEPFTVAFGSGDNVPASAMTLKSVETETLAANSTAIGGAEHFAGVQLVANYEYTYNGAKIAIVWRAVLRDGSHYIRTEMDLTGVDAVDMYNIIPMIYNVDTNAAGSTPKVVGNTRGATIVSNKIFAGLETPMAYNTVGEATGEEDAWNLKEEKPVIALTASSWSQVASGQVPPRLTELTAKNYPNVLAYKIENITLKKGQKAEIKVEYKSGNHRLNLCGADLLDAQGSLVTGDYKVGYTGTASENNVFNLTASNDGTYTIRVFVENATESIDATSNITVKIYEPKEGVVVNTAVVGIQGRWSRNTTLAKGETWKVGAVVGLIAQDGTQNDANIRNTQKRRSFLAYSERERAVPWRAFPCYISWYELNIDRNNAADPTQNMNANQVLDVLANWKTNFYDKYGVAPTAFIIDDGWDNYGPWTFHAGFPNEMRDIAVAAKEMGAGIGAWLGPVGGYGTSGNYRRSYWNQNNRGGMQLSNPAYYQVFLDAAKNLVCNQDGQAGFNRSTDNYIFFKYDGISAQPSAIGPDAGDTGNENAEGIIRLERYVREELREDIFFNTTVGTWASPFWYQITDATWRQEGDYGEIGNNSIDREKWITYRDRLVYQNYVSNSPLCPINTLMTHGFILSNFGAVSKNMTYEAVLREMRCAFLCGSGMVELYNDYALMNSINNGKLWEDLAECIAWQKKNADVLPDAHWVGGNPWNGASQEVYGWASWNGVKATLALRNGGNNAQTYKFTLREALEIPANITGAIILNKSFKVQDALQGLTEGTAIDIDAELTVTLPASSVFAFDGRNADIPEEVNYTPNFTGAKSTTGRLVGTISVGNDTYTMPTGTRNSYTDLTETKTFTVQAGTTVALGMTQNPGTWMNAFVYVDMDNNGFTAGIAGDNYTPTGDLVSYSFYNQGYSDDNNGRNSAGTSISGNSRSTLALPNWTVPAELTPGEYRIRFKYDWCNINPAGDTGNYFNGTFTSHGGEIIDAKLVVAPAPVVYETEEIAIPTEDGVYRIYWKKDNRGYLAYHNSYPTKGVLADVTLGSYGSMHFNSATDPVELEWYLITSENDNKYLFNVTNGKFLSYSEESADAAKAAYFDAARPCPITIAQNTSYTDYSIIKASVDGRDCLLSSGCGASSKTEYPIRWNSNISGDMGDGGSPLIFVKVIGFPVDEAILAQAEAAINDYENPVEADVNFEWTTSTPWTAVEHSAYYTSTVFNDNVLADGSIEYIEGEITVGGARTATVTFTYSGGSCALNVRGVEVIDELGNIVAGDYHVGKTGENHTDNVYTVTVAEAGTYKVRCYATFNNANRANATNGTITVAFAKEDVMNLTKSVTFTAEYSTLYLGYKVAVPAGVEAYVLTGVNPTWVELTQLHNVIPANTAVILKGTAASTYNFYYTSSEADNVEINYLEGSIADRYVQGDAYVLGLVDGEVCLAKAVLNQVGNTSFKNNANKAYLKVAPGAALSANLRFGEDGTTAIENVEVVTEDVIFDLSGRRISEITEKGVYIVNGKKVIK